MGETERSNAERPNQASCMPELQTVPLLENDDPSIIYYPTCTRVKRCGGCCTHPFLSCQPTATETRNFEVIHSHLIKCYRYIYMLFQLITLLINVLKIFVTALESNNGLRYQGKRIVPIEEHTQCTCDCKIKETVI